MAERNKLSGRCILAAVAGVILLLCLWGVINEKNERDKYLAEYEKGIEYINSGNYLKASVAFDNIPDEYGCEDLEYLRAYANCLYYNNEDSPSGAHRYMEKIPEDYSGAFADEIKALRPEIDKKYSDYCAQEEILERQYRESKRKEQQEQTTTTASSSNKSSYKPNYNYPEDEYNVYDYYDPEDFYYDYEDDFWDYEDAEDYYDEAWYDFDY
ncbi:MAG: hypothetical protein MRZ61_05915 [Oscillospiraceae bacterium]|nr:hypothetical protein [Oscillospiraceae bacterium]